MSEPVIIGNATLYNMDCMDYMRGLPDKAFDLAIVDPPYGIDINSSGRLGHYGGKGKEWDAGIPDDEYFTQLYRVSKNQIIWGGNYFYLAATRCFLIWDKQQPEGVSFASCEYAWTSFDQSAKTYYQRPINADIERIHPTQKPVKLYQWLLTNYAKKGDRILDTHLGSGSSAIAAHNLGFDFVGCELDSDYYDAAVKRFNAHAAQQSLFTAPEIVKAKQDVLL
jgi:site-specific DNA-methyltransferase (adenine-specific)